MQNGRVIAHAFRKLKPYEKNCLNNELVLVVVVFSLKILHHYLYGLHVDLFKDHKGVQYAFTQNNLIFSQRS